MNETKKNSYKSLTEKMSDEELKHIIAGCGDDDEECTSDVCTLKCKDGHVECIETCPSGDDAANWCKCHVDY